MAEDADNAVVEGAAVEPETPEAAPEDPPKKKRGRPPGTKAILLKDCSLDGLSMTPRGTEVRLTAEQHKFLAERGVVE